MTKKRIYFIGIKGVGMTALAQLYQSMNYDVIGSDVVDKFFTDEVLQKSNISYFEGFKITNIPLDIDFFIISGAYYQKGIKSQNIEVNEVLNRGLPILTYSQALGKISESYISLGVAGSHGKTTTSALLAYTMQELGEDPFAIIGSMVPQFGGNARISKNGSEYLVAECDEYQNHFLDFNPNAIILNNIDFDHPDFFPNRDIYYQSFVKFILKLPENGFAVVNGDDDLIREYILENEDINVDLVTFGISQDNDFYLDDDDFIFYKNKKLIKLELSIIGKHNKINALGVFSLLYKLNYDIKGIVAGIKKFVGVKRRMEFKGKSQNGTLIYDDYAHHPSEIKATLEGVKEYFVDKKIYCAFQPHTFSRTKALINDFADSFINIEKLYLFDIYGSAREGEGDISIKDLLNLIQSRYPELNVEYVSHFDDVVSELKNLSSQDVFITMGAGNIWLLGEKVIK